nr:excalibur domain-containing protein [Mycobacterium malmoense]
MRRLTLLTIGFAVGLAFAPSAGANPSDVSFRQSTGPYVAPIPQAPGSSCDPNYSGACVPIASDVDCAGGSGNGPAYVSGPVTVVGKDIYRLDRDGNGVGCE